MEHQTAAASEQPTLMWSPRPEQVQSLATDELRRSFLIEKLFNGERLSWTFTDLDRMSVGGVSPGTSPVTLANVKQTGADFFLARREMGTINIGGAGTVRVDGKSYELNNLDTLYIGLGAKSVEFASHRRLTQPRSRA